MADTIEFIKQDKALYNPPRKPVFIEVPNLWFLMADGSGAPEGGCYQNAVGALYAVAYTIKMSKMGDWQPPGYQDFKVPPLEGLWSADSATKGMEPDRSKWRWTSLLRMPGYVTPAVLAWAIDAAARKKPGIDFSPLRLEHWQEGPCVQMMHIGPYATEPETLEKMHAFMAENSLQDITNNTNHRHHEVYLGDPRRTAPEKWRTVVRHPVK